MPNDEGSSSHCESAIPPLQPSFYRPELDFLRFFAFLAVFIQHSLPQSAIAYRAHGLPQFDALWMAAVQRSGAYGVDLFFVLSAYLITELLQREFTSTGKVDVRSFYIRRVLRIWPLYFFFLGLCMLLSRYGVVGQHLKTTYVLAFVFLAGNWICAFRGYPNSAAAPLWSVSLEEQFYLTWPVLMLLVHVKRLMQVGICMIVFSSVIRLALFFLGVKHPGVWCNTFARLDPIGCGIILAACLNGRRPTLSKLDRLVLGTIAIMTLLFVGRYIPLDVPRLPNLLGGYPAVALASSVLVFLILACDLSTLPATISSSGIYLGRISYGLYVFHVLAIELVNRTIPESFVIRLPLALMLTVGFSAISYRYLEKPFLRLKLRFTHVSSRPGG